MNERLPEPANIDEYNDRLKNTLEITEAGDRSRIRQPCPFCAAPGFFDTPIILAMETWLLGSFCYHCQRGAKAVFKDMPGGVGMEIVQTRGSDPPYWLNPRMRRESEVVR